MTTIAILGATGKTGRGVVQNLLDKDVNLKIYVRSREKLLNLFPTLASNPRVEIFQGSISNTELISKCLHSAQIIICTLGENENIPSVHVLEDGARAIVNAMDPKSRIIFLSSSTWNPKLVADTPPVILWMIKHAFFYPYADLLRAHSVLSSANVLLIQPPGLVEDEPSGYELSTEHTRLTVSYADLAAGIVETAINPDYANLNAVGISSKNGDNYAKYGPILGSRIIKGLSASYIPGFWTIHSALTTISRWFWIA